MKRSRAITLAIGGWLAVVAPAGAQERPVVFLHGLMADGSAWANAAARLGSTLAITPYLPNTDEAAAYENQAWNAQSALGFLDGSTIAIGHSNGGLVARQWSRLHPLSGVITVGTPHWGAPLIYNFESYAYGYGFTLQSLVFDLISEFGWNCCSWQWVLQQIAEGLSWSLGGFDVSMSEMFLRLGLYWAHPVALEMHPQSNFLADINSGGNMSREAGTIPVRVGVVSRAHNFYWGGPIRAAFPDSADYLASVRDMAALALDALAFHIWVTAEPGDADAWGLSTRLWNVAGYLAGMDEWWCRAVSAVGFTSCWENDTVVPVWSQDYSAIGPGIGFGWMPDGPAHTQESEWSDDMLSLIMTQYMGVGSR